MEEPGHRAASMEATPTTTWVNQTVTTIPDSNYLLSSTDLHISILLKMSLWGIPTESLDWSLGDIVSQQPVQLGENYPLPSFKCSCNMDIFVIQCMHPPPKKQTSNVGFLSPPLCWIQPESSPSPQIGWRIEETAGTKGRVGLSWFSC